MSIITDYIEMQAPEVQKVCYKVHTLIKTEIPMAEEQIKYGLPTYYYKENVIHFGANKNHLGIYPTPSAIIALKDQLKAYKYSKGAVQFPYDDVPYDLILTFVKYRIKEIEEKGQKK